MHCPHSQDGPIDAEWGLAAKQTKTGRHMTYPPGNVTKMMGNYARMSENHTYCICIISMSHVPYDRMRLKWRMHLTDY